VFTNLKTQEGLRDVIDFIRTRGLFETVAA
jgi:hypothetical protein